MSLQHLETKRSGSVLAATIGDRFWYKGTEYQVKTAQVNPSTATTTEIVAAVVGKQLMVVDWWGNTDTAQTVTIQDDNGSPVVIERQYMAATGGKNRGGFAVNDRLGTSGQALDVVTSNSGNAFVKVWYIEV